MKLEWLAGYPVLVWRLDEPMLAISSAPFGGGIGQRSWVLNSSVTRGYDRTDPDAHVAEMAESLGLAGPGVGMLTGLDVREVVHRKDGGVSASVTTGVAGSEIWAAALGSAIEHRAGTINAVCWLPVRMSDAALVNLVATVAEAKAQALIEAGVPGTGTYTDATVVLCPASGEVERYGGPRSRYGSRVARAVHSAITAGLGME